MQALNGSPAPRLSGLTPTGGINVLSILRFFGGAGLGGLWLAFNGGAPEAKQMLASAEQVLDNSQFWQHQSDGLVTFMAADLCRFYRLPLPFQELAVVTDRFPLKPLLPLLRSHGRFYVLALRQNEVRLLQCTRQVVTTVELEGIPKSMAEALKYDDPERQLQFRTGTPPGTGRRPAIFHGHGVGIDDAKDNILRYFRQVDHGWRALLRGEQAPLVLASVDYLLPIYREATTYAHLMDEGVSGNPEGRLAQELHAQAWKLAEPYFRQADEDLLDLAAMLTISNSGSVYAVEPDKVPGEMPLAAVYRY